MKRLRLFFTGLVIAALASVGGVSCGNPLMRDILKPLHEKRPVNAVVPAPGGLPSTPQGYALGDLAIPLTVTVGNGAAVTAQGGTLSYQWYSSSVNSNAGGIVLTGHTSASYTPSTGSLGDTWYYVEITNTLPDNGDGGTKTAGAKSGTVQISVMTAADFINFTDFGPGAVITADTVAAGGLEAYINSIKTVPGNYAVTLSGGTSTLTDVGDTHSFELVSGVTVSLRGSGTVSRSASTLSGQIWRVQSGAKLILRDTVILRGGPNRPVVEVYRGEFVMEGGEITGSTNGGGPGGGVWIRGGSFTMKDGVIHGNHANGSGGGVYVGIDGAFTGTFTMTGGTIQDNRTFGYGGGVGVNSSSSFIKTGGTIYGDTDQVYVSGTVDNTSTINPGNAVSYGNAVHYRNGNLGPGDNLSTGDFTNPLWDD
jgi:hypothetical protein